ncbi:hypothetical protein GGF32_007397 [Allomyces javanicus]|nr:hypothetical protein GGF32_007397 [Allomyces javanicus]
MMSNPLRDDLARAWVMALPRSLRTLELKGECLGANMVAVLLDRMLVPLATFLEDDNPFREQLTARFDGVWKGDFEVGT